MKSITRLLLILSLLVFLSYSVLAPCQQEDSETGEITYLFDPSNCPPNDLNAMIQEDPEARAQYLNQEYGLPLNVGRAMDVTSTSPDLALRLSSTVPHFELPEDLTGSLTVGEGVRVSVTEAGSLEPVTLTGGFVEVVNGKIVSLLDAQVEGFIAGEYISTQRSTITMITNNDGGQSILIPPGARVFFGDTMIESTGSKLLEVGLYDLPNLDLGFYAGSAAHIESPGQEPFDITTPFSGGEVHLARDTQGDLLYMDISQSLAADFPGFLSFISWNGDSRYSFLGTDNCQDGLTCVAREGNRLDVLTTLDTDLDMHVNEIPQDSPGGSLGINFMNIDAAYLEGMLNQELDSEQPPRIYFFEDSVGDFGFGERGTHLARWNLYGLEGRNTDDNNLPFTEMAMFLDKINKVNGEFHTDRLNYDDDGSCCQNPVEPCRLVLELNNLGTLEEMVASYDEVSCDGLCTEDDIMDFYEAFYVKFGYYPLFRADVSTVSPLSSYLSRLMGDSSLYSEVIFLPYFDSDGEFEGFDMFDPSNVAPIGFDSENEELLEEIAYYIELGLMDPVAYDIVAEELGIEVSDTSYSYGSSVENIPDLITQYNGPTYFPDNDDFFTPQEEEAVRELNKYIRENHLADKEPFAIVNLIEDRDLNHEVTYSEKVKYCASFRTHSQHMGEACASLGFE